MSEDTQGQSFEDRARAATAAVRAAKAAKGGGRGRGGGDDGPDPDAWMVTFSDLLVLLMTFFVLIFASQDPIEEKLFSAFGQSSGVFGLFRTSFFETVTVVQRQDMSQDRLEVFLQDVGAVNVEVKQEARGLAITLPTDALFRPGSAALNATGVKRIGQLSQLLRFSRHEIRVQGHTDNREAGDANWALSVERAHAVLLQLVKNKVDKQRMSLVGYGPARPRFSNASRLGRQRNRRVEIVILNRGEEQ